MEGGTLGRGEGGRGGRGKVYGKFAEQLVIAGAGTKGLAEFADGLALSPRRSAGTWAQGTRALAAMLAQSEHIRSLPKSAIQGIPAKFGPSYSGWAASLTI